MVTRCSPYPSVNRTAVCQQRRATEWGLCSTMLQQEIRGPASSLPSLGLQRHRVQRDNGWTTGRTYAGRARGDLHARAYPDQRRPGQRFRLAGGQLRESESAGGTSRPVPEPGHSDRSICRGKPLWLQRWRSHPGRRAKQVLHARPATSLPCAVHHDQSRRSGACRTTKAAPASSLPPTVFFWTSALRLRAMSSVFSIISCQSFRRSPRLRSRWCRQHRQLKAQYGHDNGLNNGTVPVGPYAAGDGIVDGYDNIAPNAAAEPTSYRAHRRRRPQR